MSHTILMSEETFMCLLINESLRNELKSSFIEHEKKTFEQLGFVQEKTTFANNTILIRTLNEPSIGGKHTVIINR